MSHQRRTHSFHFSPDQMPATVRKANPASTPQIAPPCLRSAAHIVEGGGDKVEISIEYCVDGEHYNQFKVVINGKTEYLELEDVEKMFEQADEALCEHFSHNKPE